MLLLIVTPQLVLAGTSSREPSRALLLFSLPPSTTCRGHTPFVRLPIAQAPTLNSALCTLRSSSTTPINLRRPRLLSFEVDGVRSLAAFLYRDSDAERTWPFFIFASHTTGLALYSGVQQHHQCTQKCPTSTSNSAHRITLLSHCMRLYQALRALYVGFRFHYYRYRIVYLYFGVSIR